MNYKYLFLGIFLGIILSILIYFIYTYVYLPTTKYSKNKVGTVKYSLVESSLTLPISQFYKSDPVNPRYSIELWLFINPSTITNSNSKTTINIFNIGSTTTSIISLDLGVDMSLTVKTQETVVKSTPPTIITTNFPLQKWVQVIISIDNYLLDVYLDGKLMNSIVASSTITIPSITNNIVFTKNDLYVSGLNLNPSPITSSTAMENYKIGKSKVNGTTQVSLALTKNDNPIKSFYYF